MCVSAGRDKCRSDYEDKLRSELEQVRLRSEMEIDRLKSSTHEMYERENRLTSVSLPLPVRCVNWFHQGCHP